MMKTFKIIAFLMLGAVTFPATSQTTDLARIEYTYFPQSDSDNSFRRFRTFVNLPIKLNGKGAYLIPGVEYRNVNFKYKNSEAFTTNNLDRFQSFTGKIGYTFKMNELWRFGAETGVKIASNFATSELVKDDFIYTGSVYFIKIKEDERYIEPWRLILGLSYSTTTGFPFPLPVINYYKRFDENWSYGLGIPKTNLKYYFNNKHEVQGFVTLDGFFANIQQNFNPYPQTNPGANRLAESMSMTIVLSGLGYQYNITDNIAFYTYAGYTVMNDIRLRDKDREDLYTIDENNTFYARGGLKFSIL
ncbi:MULTISPECIES: DUF6268 family outer membrane beta-barrel protein [Salegentibacter]|uniref:DUF6268 domain-containing protein n=1 Tax=Salegentibacter agarivorans TaxID=345907 RepID=A0A1I2JV24_9FLAO|nr:DUF6268 family outer membrane beta-barrel protein [Salegentibacter agarivorans]APS39022.1 hypothetical protein AO058_09135 [Salegentibacter sp. T436]SFF57730.1 hypothetical protein SAMN04488033_1017 [Salegentibacter agarivorans]